MRNIHEISTLDLYAFDAPGGTKLLIHATGEVSRSGWSEVRLVARYGTRPPVDGLWELDFVGRPPRGAAVDAALRLSATAVLGRPDWCRGVRVYAATNSQTASPLAVSLTTGEQDIRESLGTERQEHTIAAYEQAFQAIPGRTQRRERHEIAITVEGPRGSMPPAGLAAELATLEASRVVAAHAQGGGAMWRTAAALLERVQAALGSDFQVRLDERTRWIESQD